MLKNRTEGTQAAFVSFRDCFLILRSIIHEEKVIEDFFKLAFNAHAVVLGRTFCLRSGTGGTTVHLKLVEDFA